MLFIKQKASPREQELEKVLIGKKIIYKNIERTVVRPYIMDGCCPPFLIVFFLIADNQPTLKVMVEETKEKELIDGMDNPEFKIETIAALIVQSEF